ncbi:phage antirepressor N-terminal domain-containing protein [Pseudomonas atacamensis]|uniref:phage antirepressor N-terminal domain-containing protein n=1 Tax=Pseudomonas atacamensis TaxID=2565368 RepID=UPI0021D9A041|nr:phage antirepressor N-terminal domain-containing protein [Pseudomonas atacamensis]
MMAVPFYEDIVVLVGQDDEPYVSIKPIVENIGLAWQVQHRKLRERFDSVITEMVTTGGDGKQYAMTCFPLRKLPAWLYSISPNKVEPDLRGKIIRYQEECDDGRLRRFDSTVSKIDTVVENSGVEEREINKL